MTNYFSSKNLLRSLRIVKIFSLLALSNILFLQCINPPDFIGGDLIPPQDIFRVKTDTSFTLSVFTEPYDTVVTSYFSEAIVGETFDPVFGKTRASFLTQVSIPTLGHDFGTNPVLDSAFVYFGLSTQFGDEPININIYELVDSLVVDSSYNSLSPIDNWFSPTPIGSAPVPFNGDDDILKIPLDHNWVYDKLINPTLTDTTIMLNQKNFLKHFFGIHVAPSTTFDTHKKGMYYFNYLGTNSKMVLYYKNDEQEVDTVSLFYTYVFSDASLRFNHFEHNVEAADPDIKVSFNPRGSEQDSVFYVNGFGSAKGVLVLDDLVNWIDSMPVAINRAELRIELEEQSNLPVDSLLKNLFIYQMVDNKSTNILDYSINGENHGGSYSRSKKYYSFNITYHLQSLLNDSDSNNVLYIEPRGAFQRSGGAVLRSGNHSSRMKLIITYTKL
ncbi:MAG: hypothetical protein CVT98_01775 [Bacteroidetes bacterium HGW-Bacteroidetes-15]|nr:MAG: hypothetical protein CVT98_01775 [Bacteroidetes bacterium HGW-Bacteroidetes-15]